MRIVLSLSKSTATTGNPGNDWISRIIFVSVMVLSTLRVGERTPEKKDAKATRVMERYSPGRAAPGSGTSPKIDIETVMPAFLDAIKSIVDKDQSPSQWTPDAKKKLRRWAIERLQEISNSKRTYVMRERADEPMWVISSPTVLVEIVKTKLRTHRKKKGNKLSKCRSVLSSSASRNRKKAPWMVRHFPVGTTFQLFVDRGMLEMTVIGSDGSGGNHMIQVHSEVFGMTPNGDRAFCWTSCFAPPFSKQEIEQVQEFKERNKRKQAKKALSDIVGPPSSDGSGSPTKASLPPAAGSEDETEPASEAASQKRKSQLNVPPSPNAAGNNDAVNDGAVDDSEKEGSRSSRPLRRQLTLEESIGGMESGTSLYDELTQEAAKRTLRNFGEVNNDSDCELVAPVGNLKEAKQAEESADKFREMAEAELMTEEALKMEPEEDQTEGKTMK